MLKIMNAKEDNERARRPVTLSPEDVRKAIDLLRILTGSENAEKLGNNCCPASGELLAVAEFSQVVRHGRAHYFSPAMFGEPAWDLLLALFVGHCESAAPTVSNLAKAANVPVSTAVRWIDYLEKKELVEREPSGVDRRAWTVTLSANGQSRLKRYFADVLDRLESRRLQLAEA